MLVAGIMDVDVSYQGQKEVLRLYVVQGDGPTLLGREWLRAIRLDWANIGLTSIANSQRRVEALLEKYAEVFSEGIGEIANFQATLTLKEGAKPCFFKPRPVPFALKKL